MILFTLIFLTGSGAFIIRLLAGSRKLYYIEEAKMYIQTYSSFRYITITFSSQRIDRISEKSDYLKVPRGLDCCASFFIDSIHKRIYASANTAGEVHEENYRIDAIFGSSANAGERRLSQLPYIGITSCFWGSAQVRLKKSGNNHFRRLKPVRPRTGSYGVGVNFLPIYEP